MIATPTDSYDRRTCIVTTLNSLEQLSRTFDTAMDSLLVSTEQLEVRLESMKQRTMKLSFEHVKKIEAPCTYPIFQDDTVNHHCVSHSRTVRAACREKSSSNNNSPFVEVKEESTVSDLWLDRASAFEERQACRQALESLVMPSILSLSPTKAEDWKDVSAISTTNNSDNDNHVDGIMKRESSQSVSPDLDIMSTTSTISARTTATARWNYQKYKKQTKDQGTKNSSKFRQEAMKGSLPYLCDVLHDAYSSKRFFEPQPNNILQYHQLQHESQQTLYTTTTNNNNDTDSQNNIIQQKEMKVDEQSTPLRATSKKINVSDDNDDENEKKANNPKIDLNQSTELILPKLVDIDRKGHVPLPADLPF